MSSVWLCLGGLGAGLASLACIAEVAQLTHLDTHAIVKVLERFFETISIPERISIDGGLQFRGDFASWCKGLGMVHKQTSPYHPEANEHVEQAVGAIKNY